jgi:broad specificity phosphatase PhoE
MAAVSKLILVKHAAPEVQPGVSSEQWHLSERGRASCAALAEALRVHQPGVVVSSEEPKAKQTAELVGQHLGLTWQTAPGLHEHDRRAVPHMRSSEFISNVELMLRKRDERVLGHESAGEALRRFRDALRDVLAQHANETVAVVSHGTVIALYVAEHTQDHTAFELWRKLGLPSFVVLSRPELKVESVFGRIG